MYGHERFKNESNAVGENMHENIMPVLWRFSCFTAQLAKQLKRRKVSGILLIQSYVATLLLFAGLYTATFRFNVSMILLIKAA